jgi:hypothetical protein
MWWEKGKREWHDLKDGMNQDLMLYLMEKLATIKFNCWR